MGETATEEGRLSIVFLDEADGLLSSQNRAKVNTLKMLWEDKRDLDGVILILTTNHYKRLTDDGLQSRINNRIHFNPLSPDQQKQLIVRTFASMGGGSGHKLEMSDEDWKKLLPTVKESNGHHFDEWCNNVVRKVNCDFRKERRPDNTIRLKDLLETSTGTQGSSSDALPLTGTQKVDKFDAWIRGNFKTPKPELRFAILGAKGTESERLIYLESGIIKDRDLTPDDILLCCPGINQKNLSNARRDRAFLTGGPFDDAREFIQNRFKAVLPLCEFEELTRTPTNATVMRVPINRKKTYGPDPDADGDLPLDQVPEIHIGYELQAAMRGTRTQGWTIGNVMFTSPPTMTDEKAKQMLQGRQDWALVKKMVEKGSTLEQLVKLECNTDALKQSRKFERSELHEFGIV